MPVPENEKLNDLCARTGKRSSKSYVPIPENKRLRLKKLWRLEITERFHLVNQFLASKHPYCALSVFKPNTTNRAPNPL